MKFIYILTSLISFYSFSQNKNFKSDTIYICFKNNSKYEKVNLIKNNNNPELNLKIYEFDLGDNYNKISFISSKYLNFDDIESNNPADVKTLNKSFLKKNKEIILDVDYFVKNNLKDVFFKIYGKEIYIIDHNDFKNKNIIARKIILQNTTYFEE